MSKDKDYFIIEEINGINRYQGTDQLIHIKANYKFFESEEVQRTVDRKEVGFVFSGMNLNSNIDTINKLLLNLCDLKVLLDLNQ